MEINRSFSDALFESLLVERRTARHSLVSIKSQSAPELQASPFSLFFFPPSIQKHMLNKHHIQILPTVPKPQVPAPSSRPSQAQSSRQSPPRTAPLSIANSPRQSNKLRLLLASRPNNNNNNNNNDDDVRLLSSPLPPACKFSNWDFEDYQMSNLKSFRHAAAVEEGRPASSGRLRMAEPGGRKLAWIKATFAVAVLALAIAVIGLGIGVWQIVH
ncbi:hypothetical protein F4680DRAFT_420724 [Xylaria scruposa]|nr:hypothetical protein F4680DRAFT_420724 [Xylaria scruposa]